MTTKLSIRYTLNQIEEIIFKGFDYQISDEVIEKISNLAIQVGSPDYVKTPIFKKNDNPIKAEPAAMSTSKENFDNKKKKRNRGNEIVNDEDWGNLRTFQPTKIEVKVGIDADFDLIRSLINKITDKNYIDIRNKIVDIMEKVADEHVESNLTNIGTNIFDIATSNRYYSKIYADLYTDLSSKFEFIRIKYQENLQRFTDLFNNIEYVNPSVDYDKFCEINKTNEKRKSLASFYINLMNNGIISKVEIMVITRNLLDKIYKFISLEDKKNEVDELTETIALLYNKTLYENDTGNNYDDIDGYKISEIIHKIANSKVKDYKSLTNKALFRFMDLIDM